MTREGGVTEGAGGWGLGVALTPLVRGRQPSCNRLDKTPVVYVLKGRYNTFPIRSPAPWSVGVMTLAHLIMFTVSIRDTPKVSSRLPRSRIVPFYCSPSVRHFRSPSPRFLQGHPVSFHWHLLQKQVPKPTTAVEECVVHILSAFRVSL